MLKKHESLAATGKEQKKSKQCAKAFPSMPSAVLQARVGYLPRVGRHAEEIVELVADLAPLGAAPATVTVGGPRAGRRPQSGGEETSRWRGG
jgi:hypothetical protein